MRGLSWTGGLKIKIWIQVLNQEIHCWTNTNKSLRQHSPRIRLNEQIAVILTQLTHSQSPIQQLSLLVEEVNLSPQHALETLPGQRHCPTSLLQSLQEYSMQLNVLLNSDDQDAKGNDDIRTMRMKLYFFWLAGGGSGVSVNRFFWHARANWQHVNEAYEFRL